MPKSTKIEKKINKNRKEARWSPGSMRSYWISECNTAGHIYATAEWRVQKARNPNDLRSWTTNGRIEHTPNSCSLSKKKGEESEQFFLQKKFFLFRKAWHVKLMRIESSKPQTHCTNNPNVLQSFWAAFLPHSSSSGWSHLHLFDAPFYFAAAPL